jgi:PAS domain S-box-containing protein
MDNLHTPNNRRVLVIDDNPSIADDFRKILMPPPVSGQIEATERALFAAPLNDHDTPAFELDAAQQGRAGVDLVVEACRQGRPYALAFVDMRMPPGWDGVETIERLWEHDPKLQVVICTAYSDYSWGQIAKRLGRNDQLLILKKPFDTAEVCQLALALTQKWCLTRQAQWKVEELNTLVDAQTKELKDEVAARRRSEAALAARLAAIDSAHDCIVITDRRGVIEYVNPAFEKVTGYTAAEALGQKTSILKSGEHDEAFYRDLWKTILAGDVWQGEIINRRKDGTLYPERMTITPVRDAAGRIAQFVAIKRDVTQTKRAEQTQREHEAAKEAVQSLNRVLGVVGHELRTPLAAVRATTEFLVTDGVSDPEQLRVFIQNIHNEVVRMSGLLNNLLEAAHLHSGQIHWQWGDADLSAVCRQAAEMVRPFVDQQRVKLDWQIDPPNLRMQGDADAISRMLVNFVHNSVKHTPQGFIRVDVSRVNTPDGDRVRFRITDSGEGIAQDIVKKLGKAFVLNNGFAGSDYVKGTGLGLAICKEIAAVHGGSITVRSRPGAGCTFTVVVKADLPGPAQPRAEAADILEVA